MSTAIATTHIAKTLKAFYADTAFWLEGMYQDDVLLIVNGKEAPDVDSANLADNDLVEIECGYLVTDGVEIPAGHMLATAGANVSLEDALGLWLKGQTTRFVMIEHDASIDMDALRVHLAAFHPSLKVIT